MLKINQLSARSAYEHLDDISFVVESGELIAVVGPELSGKRLLGQVIAGQEPARSGLVSVNHYRIDNQPVKARRQIGYLPGQSSLPPSLTGFEYLDLVGAIYRLAPQERLSRIQTLITELDFSQTAYSVLEQVSPASRHKIALAAALIHQPSVIVLDEPLQYLDFAGQIRATELMKAAQSEGAAIILITDNLNLAEQWADHFAVLDNGQMIAGGTLKQLTNQTRPTTHDLPGVYQTIFADDR